MAAARKGMATPLASAFSPEETRRAVSRVAQAIADRRADLARVQGFFADNAALVNLVQRLPDELSHQIMVPFGGAAFFPGSLIHTNELLVLLGYGYYADRSAKQTTEILHRRGMELEAQMEAIKATISDLKAEAKFFESTAAEASEGLVEIREEYDEEGTEIISSKTEASSSSGGISDEEHARMMARFDELEMLEKDAGSTSEDEGDDDDDEDEDAGTSEDGEENGDTLSYSNEHDNVSFGASVSGSGGNEQSQGNAQLKSALKKLGEKEALQGSSLAPSGSTSITNSEVQASLRKAVSFKDENGQIVSSSRYSSGPKVSSSRDRKIHLVDKRLSRDLLLNTMTVSQRSNNLGVMIVRNLLLLLLLQGPCLDSRCRREVAEYVSWTLELTQNHLFKSLATAVWHYRLNFDPGSFAVACMVEWFDACLQFVRVICLEMKKKNAYNWLHQVFSSQKNVEGIETEADRDVNLLRLIGWLIWD